MTGAALIKVLVIRDHPPGGDMASYGGTKTLAHKRFCATWENLAEPH